MHPDTRVVPFPLAEPPANQVTAQHWKTRALEAERLLADTHEKLGQAKAEWGLALMQLEARHSADLLARIVVALLIFGIGAWAGRTF